MNLAGLSVTVGLIAAALVTMPWGLLILGVLAAIGWWSRPR